jgi:hypothetical protein
MDAEQQAAGEKRVREHLIDPLLGLGLGKPTTLTKAAFETMLKTLAQMLAHASEADLFDLRERALQNPGGKDRDRFPLAARFLDWGRELAPPGQSGTGEDVSPLIGRVMAHPDFGGVALDKGFAPELLAWLRVERKWPGGWTMSKRAEAADDARRRYDDLRMKGHRGDPLCQEDRQFIAKRSAAIAECRRIAEIGAKREERT